MSGPLTDVSAWDILMGYAPETEGMGLGERSAILVDRLARSVVPDALERPVDALFARVTGRVPSAAETSEAWPDRHSYLSTGTTYSTRPSPAVLSDAWANRHAYFSQGPNYGTGPSPAMLSDAWADRHRYLRTGPAPEDMPELIDMGWGITTPEYAKRVDPEGYSLYEMFADMLAGGGTGGSGGGGGGGGDALDWARLEEDRKQWAEQLALEYASLQQQAELERLQREQQQRQFAAQLGQALNELMSQNWESALPWTLPSGTEYAPAFEPGGAVERLARIGGAEYTPQRLAVSNPPSRETLNQWLNDAIALWGK